MWLFLSVLQSRAQAPLSCPPDTAATSRLSADGSTIDGCAQPAGRLHGPARIRLADGSQWLGSYFEGQQHGAWTHLSPAGTKLEAGQFDQGVLRGEWLTWRNGVLAGRVQMTTVQEAKPTTEVHAGFGPQEVLTALDGDDLVLAAGGQLEALDHELNRLWSIALPGPAEDLQVVDGWVIALAGDEVVSIDLDGVVMRTEAPKGQQILGVAGADSVVIKDRRGRVTARSLSTGIRDWQTDTFYNPSRGVVVNGAVVLTRGRRIIGLAGDDGSEIWSVDLNGHPLDLGLLHGRVVVVDHHGTVQALDPLTGGQHWQVVEAVERPKHLSVAGHTLLLQGAKELVALDILGDGQGTMALPTAPRAVSDARAFLVQDHTLSVLGIGDGWEHTAPKDIVGVQPHPQGVFVVDERDVAWLSYAEPELGGGLMAEKPAGVGDIDIAAAGQVLQPIWQQTDHGQELWVDVSGFFSDELVAVSLTALESAGSTFEFDDGFGVTEAPGAWSLLALHPWEPRVVKGQVLGGDDDDQAALNDTLQCLGPGLEFDGELWLHDGVGLVVANGTITVETEQGLVGGQPNCLLHIGSGREALGVWSPPEQTSWVGLDIEATSVTATDDGNLAGGPDASVVLDVLVPREGNEVIEVGGPLTLSFAEQGLVLEGLVDGVSSEVTIPTGPLLIPDQTDGGEMGWLVQRSMQGSRRVGDAGWLRIGRLTSEAPSAQ